MTPAALEVLCDAAREDLTKYACNHCGARIGGHHAANCVHWGCVLPSECPGLIEAAMREVLSRPESASGASAPRPQGETP